MSEGNVVSNQQIAVALINIGSPYVKPTSALLLLSAITKALDTKDLALTEAQKRIAEQDSEIKVLREALEKIAEFGKRDVSERGEHYMLLASKALTPQLTQDEKKMTVQP